MSSHKLRRGMWHHNLCRIISFNFELNSRCLATIIQNFFSQKLDRNKLACLSFTRFFQDNVEFLSFNRVYQSGSHNCAHQLKCQPQELFTNIKLTRKKLGRSLAYFG